MRRIRWMKEEVGASDDEILTLYEMEPLIVGPLTARAWVKQDTITRRGMFIEAQISYQDEVLWRGQELLYSTPSASQDIARRLIETGLNLAHETIEALLLEADARRRRLSDMRFEMTHILLRHGPHSKKLTLETAHLVLLVNNPRASVPLWLEKVGEDSALAHRHRGEVWRIRYNPTDPLNHRAAGRESRGYYGFYEDTIQPRPGEEVSHEES